MRELQLLPSVNWFTDTGDAALVDAEFFDRIFGVVVCPLLEFSFDVFVGKSASPAGLDNHFEFVIWCTFAAFFDADVDDEPDIGLSSVDFINHEFFAVNFDVCVRHDESPNLVLEYFDNPGITEVVCTTEF